VAPSRRRRAVDGERGRAQLLDARLHPLMRRGSVGIDGAPLMRAFVQRRRRRGTRGQHSIESREERRRSRVSFLLSFSSAFLFLLLPTPLILWAYLWAVGSTWAWQIGTIRPIIYIPFRTGQTIYCHSKNPQKKNVAILKKDHILPSCLENKA
jgi:hypothetical protein